MGKITEEEIKELVLHRGLELSALIDIIIDLNGIIGVGLISLADEVNKYILKKL